MKDGRIKNYTPVPGKIPNCTLCDREWCLSKYHYHRSRQDFSVTSGRCPRLPDMNGKYDPNWCDLEGV